MNVVNTDTQIIKSEPDTTKNHIHQTPQLLTTIIPKQERSSLLAELEWDPNLEYDPLHPTDYDKIIKGINNVTSMTNILATSLNISMLIDH